MGQNQGFREEPDGKTADTRELEGTLRLQARTCANSKLKQGDLPRAGISSSVKGGAEFDLSLDTQLGRAQATIPGQTRS